MATPDDDDDDVGPVDGVIIMVVVKWVGRSQRRIHEVRSVMNTSTSIVSTTMCVLPVDISWWDIAFTYPTSMYVVDMNITSGRNVRRDAVMQIELSPSLLFSTNLKGAFLYLSREC